MGVKTAEGFILLAPSPPFKEAQPYPASIYADNPGTVQRRPRRWWTVAQHAGELIAAQRKPSLLEILPPEIITLSVPTLGLIQGGGIAK